MTLDPIGIIRSCFGEKFATPRQPGLCPAAWGELVFHPPFRSREAIRGIDGFSHIWIIFGFHQSDNSDWNPTVRPPRLGGNQRIGVFASRSTYRPNPIGLSLVSLEAIDLDDPDSPVLKLAGLDLIDGTPVYDVKPYLPYAESIPAASAGFASGEIPRLNVAIHPSATRHFNSLPQRARNLITQALALDPRPAVQTQDSDRIFGACLCGHNVQFTVNQNTCQILSVTRQEQTDY
jgi:tRNA-Thr(GGU) m(6)t(6)A37 methyltransferase TsaA